MVDLNVKISSDGIIEFVLENADDKKQCFVILLRLFSLRNKERCNTFEPKIEAPTDDKAYKTRIYMLQQISKNKHKKHFSCKFLSDSVSQNIIISL